jgi:diguanylate cyclase (GGDEF)-like protein
MRNSLRTRIRFLIGALIIALGLGSYGIFRYVADREAQRQVLSTAKDTQQVLDSYITKTQENTRLQMMSLGQVPMIRNIMAAEKDDYTVEDRLSNFASSLSLDGLAITDGKKSVRYSDEWPEDIPIDGKSPGVEEAQQEGSWSGVVPGGENIVLRVAVAVQLADGRSGILVGLKVFDRELAQTLCFSRPDRAVAFVLNGHIAASSRPLSPTKIDPGQRLHWASSYGTRYLGGLEPLANKITEDKLGFICYSNYANLVSPLREMSSIFMILLGSMLVVGLFFGEQLASGLTKPLDQVVKAAIAMRNGEQPPSFNTRGRNDEIGMLQRVFNDMVEAVERNRKLLIGLIEVDPLTELRNHRSFQEMVSIEFRHAKDISRPLHLLVIDIDDFKLFNEAHGLQDGDEVLRQVASRLRRICESPAILARYGGDEFAVLLPGFSESAADQIASEIRDGLLDLPTPVKCSIGIGDADLKGGNAKALLLSAELALRRAKQLGGDGSSRFGSLLDADQWQDSNLLSDYFTEGSLATVQALAAAVDAKDPYTKGHSQRVASLARSLAVRMGGSEAFIDQVYAAGTLHDVGKIGVPDAILAKPSQLTKEESMVMATHPVLGEVIVAKVPQLASLLPGVRHHHERWDGAGYPDGLSGEGIPLQARYLAVADTFDAMTTDRPYRKALSDQVALAEIERCAGTQFQPELAKEFVRMMRDLITVAGESVDSRTHAS